MTAETDHVKAQLAVNGSAFLKAPRRGGEKQTRAAERLYSRLNSHRKRYGLSTWRMNITDGGVLVTLRKL